MAANARERFKQTCRTILFEEFSDPEDIDAVSLDAILKNAQMQEDAGNASDEGLFEKLKSLEVRSFREFVEKFAPTVYEYIQGTTDESSLPIFGYTTSKREAARLNAKPIRIVDHTYYQMLANMYSQKGQSNKANIEFDASAVREILTPKREVREAYDMRRQMQMLARDYETCEANHESTENVAKAIVHCRQKIQEKYQNSILALLPIAIDDANRRLDQVNKGIQQLNQAALEGNSTAAITSGELTFGENGQLEFIPIEYKPENKEEVLALGAATQQKMIEAVSRDYDKTTGENASAFTKELVLSSYTPMAIAVADSGAKDLPMLQEEHAQLTKRKEKYENIFCAAKESFIKTLSDGVRKLLDVKIFFDHATVKSGEDETLPEGGGLIVANCTADKLVDDSIKAKFENIMTRLGTSSDVSKKVWFAILPNVLDSGNVELANTYDPWGDLSASNSADSKKAQGVNIPIAMLLLDIMDKARITTLFSMASDKANTFNGINKAYIERLKENLKSLGEPDLKKGRRFGNAHAVVVYPNFTLMQAGNIPVSDEPGAPSIEIPAAFIDAAYVAAGMLVATQQPQYLENHGFRGKVINDNVCVRVDIESDEIVGKITTNFNRELAYTWDSAIINCINEDNFGFAFCGDAKYDPATNKPVQNTYIYSARTFYKKNNKYKPVFWTLVKDFFKLYLNAYGKTTRTILEDFKNGDVQDWKNQPRKYSDNMVNLILRDTEKVDLNGTQELVVYFGQEEEILDVDVKEGDE